MAEKSSFANASGSETNHRPRAKNVIFCFMDGGVSHVDSFDPKPKLDRHDGQPFRDSSNPTANGNRQWLKSPWTFRRHGQSGLPVSDLFPHIASCADDLAVIRSMKADLPLHSTGVLFLHTGVNNAGRPSLGSWVSYGLGSENRNLPGFVVLSFGVVPCGGLENFSSGFLPASHQATLFQADGTPIDNIGPPTRPRRGSLAASREARPAARAGRRLRPLDRRRRRRRVGDPQLRDGLPHAVARARRARPGPRDRRRRNGSTASTRPSPANALYGIQCLRARRLVEAGVRFVEITCPPGASNGTWDQHGNLKAGAREERPRHRPGHRRPDQGPQAARPARRDAGPLGRRVRPHAALRRARRPRPPSRGLQRLAGRRRRQGRHRLRRDRRVRHARRRSASSPCTTCTPRSCTCSASITNA